MADVLIAIERWNPDGGGRERYADELAAWLRARGLRVAVACAATAAAHAAQVYRCGTVARLHAFVARWRDTHPDGAALAMIPIAAATHVQLHSGLTSLAWPAGRQARGGGWRGGLAALSSAFDTDRRKYQREEADVFAGRARLMAFSSRDAEAMAAGGVDRARITVSRPGIDATRFTAPRDRPRGGALHAVFAGHNPRLKGLRPAVIGVAAAAAAGHPVRLTVAGRGSRIAATRHAWRRRGAAIDTAGVLPQPALAALLRRADVLIHPAYYDPFPRVVLEAMACGCVPIVSRQCGAADVITSGVDGFVVERPDATAALAAALASARDEERLTTMRERASARAAAFGFDAHAARVLDWLQ